MTGRVKRFQYATAEIDGVTVVQRSRRVGRWNRSAFRVKTFWQPAVVQILRGEPATECLAGVASPQSIRFAGMHEHALVAVAGTYVVEVRVGMQHNWLPIRQRGNYSREVTDA